MVFSTRLLSKSRQLYGSQAALRLDNTTSVRFFAKEATRPSPSAFKGDAMLKNIFTDVKKFEAAIGILWQEKITIDPEDPVSVSHYARAMKTVREKASLFSESERIKDAIATETQDIPDARTYLQTLEELRIKKGLPDELGIEALIMDAFEKIESEIKKPLMRNKKKGMALPVAELDKINKM